jgi:acetyl-CoA carboxylase / biotin carboxylase 1
MEMYADEEARGGVLEPEGIVNIKYRRDKQLDTMARLDPTYGQLRAQLGDKSMTPEQTSELKLKMTEREKLLGPVYMQIALQFADLHDRAGRMEAKGTIRMPLRWQNARRFFYWRLRRRLSEEVLLKRLANAASTPATNVTSAANKETNLALLKSWTNMLDVEFDKDDRKVAEWYESHRKDIYNKIDGVKSEGISQKVAELLMANKDGGLKGVREVLSLVPTSEREGLVKYLTGA